LCKGGDASIIPKQTNKRKELLDYYNEESEESANDEENKTKKIKLDRDSNDEDIYRTGAKCVPNSEIQDPKEKGINYHCVGALRTKPGRGDPTLSMSCSDKIAKWLVLGIQGTLLSILIKQPIYFNYIVISKYSI
jgi:tRNA-specific adenosine deaminase 1